MLAIRIGLAAMVSDGYNDRRLATESVEAGVEGEAGAEFGSLTAAQVRAARAAFEERLVGAMESVRSQLDAEERRAAARERELAAAAGES